MDALTVQQVQHRKPNSWYIKAIFFKNYLCQEDILINFVISSTESNVSCRILWLLGTVKFSELPEQRVYNALLSFAHKLVYTPILQPAIELAQ